jgi:hypothetical protein
MSQKIAGMIWGLDLPPAEMNVLHAYADHADHNGENVRPSIDLIAWKTNLSERYVQKVTHRLRELGYLIPVRYAQGGRGHVTEYRIDLTHASWKPYPRKGPPRGTKPDLQEGTRTHPQEDTLPETSQPPRELKGELEDTLSLVKGELKGELGDTPILDPKDCKSPPLPPDKLGGDAATCREGSKAAPPRAARTNPRALGTNARAVRQAAVAEVAQAAQDRKAACPYCDEFGFVPLRHPDGRPHNLRCTHDVSDILAYVAHHDVVWPGAPPPDHGPAP